MTSPTANDPIKVFLVDDQALVRAGFGMVLRTQPDLAVVGEAGDGQEALDKLAEVDADVVLMDIRMPRLDGLAATRALGERPPGASRPRVIVLTTFDLDDYAYAALRAGASGFLLKDAGPEELLAAIRAVHRGDSVIAPSTTRRMIEHFMEGTASPRASTGAATTAGGEGRAGGERAAYEKAADPGADPRLAALTPRELEVLTLVGRGLTNAELCAELFLAEATVKTHIGRILAKLDLRDRVQMVMLAYETGLVTINRNS